LHALISCYRDAARIGSEMKARRTDTNALKKYLVLGTVIGRLHGAKVCSEAD
jgi:hypothetical protein